ncbi:sugar transporter [Verticillium alfalfae VaMs.102]|uniref:Sugar transporter n=1 Tax=Verticillium alfalfae (strain VaMs.102 / ATCC MYA-4576 / FGSC 10136) TaxID=526221 RepID=C9SUB4_VERA1|nr:sugar transporter [Verticillium alfalfae VaMs.102]EEY22425.1 sugar transporter [Verticillium alfalfae VaMs.102]
MLGKSNNPKPKKSAIGDDLAELIPNDGVAWYRKRHLLRLNYYCLCMCLLAAANGYDGSMMNGLMALPQWFNFMNHPKGAWLGFINAIQALSSTLAYPMVAYFANRWVARRAFMLDTSSWYLVLFYKPSHQTLPASSSVAFSWASQAHELFATKGNRHRAFISVTLGIFAQWNGVGVVSYYLALVLQSVGITSVTHQTLISGCLQIWNLFFAVLAAVNVDRVGRRPLFLLSSGGMLISYIIISGLSGSFAQTGSSSVGLAVVPFLYIYYGFYDLAFTPLVVSYPAEIWPYQLRARGIALTQLSTYFAIFFNIFVNPIALDAIGWKYYIVFAVILVIVTVTVYFCYPETKGHSLEEMSVIFDGVEAAIISENAVMAIKGADVDHKEMA